MKKVNPKQYTQTTILTGSGKRITKVLQHYWSLQMKEEVNKTGELFNETKKIFGV